MSTGFRRPSVFSELWDEVMPQAIGDANKHLIGSKTSVPDRLLHFTDATGAVGILREKYLRVSRSRSSNDPLEVEYGLEIARECLLELKSRDANVGMFKEEVSNALNGLPFVDKRPRDLPDPHVCCFSAPGAKAQDDIPRWALYGQKGSGFILVFDGKRLAAKPFFDLVRVVYNPNQQRMLFRRTLRRGLQAASDVRGKIASRGGGEVARGRFTRIVGNAFGIVISMQAAVMKRPTFQFEDEWRLVVSYADWPNVKDQGPEFDVVASGSIMKSYYKYPITPEDLKSVIVGAREADLNMPVVKMLLKERRFSTRTRVHRGTSALRG